VPLTGTESSGAFGITLADSMIGLAGWEAVGGVGDAVQPDSPSAAAPAPASHSADFFISRSSRRLHPQGAILHPVAEMLGAGVS
jgi:hypothetical protein